MKSLRAVALFVWFGACSKPCPDIQCVPTISVSYAMALSEPYTLELSVLGNAYPAVDCPASMAPMFKSGVSCDGSGFTIQGPELFFGADPPTSIDVQVVRLTGSGGDLVTNTPTTTHIRGSANGDGCEMNCYRAQGSLDVPSP